MYHNQWCCTWALNICDECLWHAQGSDVSSHIHMPDDMEHYLFILHDTVSFVCAFWCLHCDLFKKRKLLWSCFLFRMLASSDYNNNNNNNNNGYLEHLTCTGPKSLHILYWNAHIFKIQHMQLKHTCTHACTHTYVHACIYSHTHTHTALQ